MAEAIGLVASIITITATVLEGVRGVRNLYRIPEELKTLQVQNELHIRDHEMTILGTS